MRAATGLRANSLAIGGFRVPPQSGHEGSKLRKEAVDEKLRNGRSALWWPHEERSCGTATGGCSELVDDRGVPGVIS